MTEDTIYTLKPISSAQNVLYIDIGTALVPNRKFCHYNIQDKLVCDVDTFGKAENFMFEASGHDTYHLSLKNNNKCLTKDGGYKQCVSDNNFSISDNKLSHHDDKKQCYYDIDTELMMCDDTISTTRYEIYVGDWPSDKSIVGDDI